MAAERPTAIADINITPLIDVMLVLLILFMLVTPVANRALDTALPHASGAGTSPGPALLLGIGEAGFTLNQAPVATVADLEERLRAIFGTRVDKTLFVRASGGVPYGRVVEALDAAKGAGAERIGILPKPDR